MRLAGALLLAVCAAAAYGQGPPPFDGPGGPPHGDRGGRGPGPRADFAGKWWTNPAVIRRLGLTGDQQRDIENVFQQNRLKLIDLTAALEKEEATLDPLLLADHPQEAKVLAQIDRVAEARAALEKANARMLFGFRMLLTQDQWRELRSSGDNARTPRDHDRPRGPGR